jgi:hypothetical protein
MFSRASVTLLPHRGPDAVLLQVYCNRRKIDLCFDTPQTALNFSAFAFRSA